MNIEMILAIGLVLLLVFSFVQVFQINSLNSKITGSAAAGSGAVDMTGWTEEEIMMYEHHGTLPARLQSRSQPKSSGGMVGGC